MARRLIQAGKTAGDKSLPGPDSMCHNLYRWERGLDSPSERYRLYYSRALGISPGQFGTHADGPCPDDFTATADMVTRLLPVRVTPGGEELKAAMARLRDPAHRDELSFLLGYASAMMAATQHRNGTSTDARPDHHAAGTAEE